MGINENFKELQIDNSMKLNNTNLPIWMCWFQGLESIPAFNKICINRWKILNPDRKLYLIDNKNIAQFVPEYNLLLNPKRSNAANSDLLRLLLLEKYGGIWIDASVLPMMSISKFLPEIINDTGFFAYRFLSRSMNPEVGNRDITSWFLCSKSPNNYIINRIKENFIDLYLKDTDEFKYYTFHQISCDLYDDDIKFKSIINNMVQISERIPHSLVEIGESKIYQKSDINPSFMFKRPHQRYLKYLLLCKENISIKEIKSLYNNEKKGP